MSLSIRRQIENELIRAGIYPGLQVRIGACRTAGRAGDPAEDGSLRWILTTEQPATVFDWMRFDFVDEILLMDGMTVPAIKQVPFLDSHSRRSVDDILGSVSDFQPLRVAGYEAVSGAVNFAADDKSQRTMQKALDGHLTDGSVGYAITRSIWIPDGEKAIVRGRQFEGPLKVSYEWALKEFSGTPIGADTLAKVRSLAMMAV